MMKIYDSGSIELMRILNREEEKTADVDEAVAAIIKDVRARGDAALFAYSEKFDGVKLTSLQVLAAEIDAAMTAIEPEFIETLEEAIENITDFHRRQRRENFIVNERPGIVLGQRVTPVEKAGIYVPGGTASYPSSVLMNALPAKLAGVSEIVMVSPAGKDGQIPAVILAAAKLAGVTKIFKIGGAQAVAALAYGTESVPKVDKIVGPGNVYVAAAKRMVFGTVDIDMIAGPSEILVLADGSCEPRYVAADLLSQAEHDRMAAAVLVTDSRKLALDVQREVESQLAALPRQEIARASIEANGKIIVAGSMEEAVDISNAIAPEHLEICVDDPFRLLNLVKNAGSVFLGKNAPEALGDYFAGPNHILPTGGTARFSSPLGVDDFQKRSSFLYYTGEALAGVADRVVAFAEREGLAGHGKSVSIRFEK